MDAFYDNYYNGIYNLRINEYEQAVDCFNAALIVKPSDAGSIYNRGFAFYKLLIYDKALDDFNKVLELMPEHEKAMIYKNLILSKHY